MNVRFELKGAPGYRDGVEFIPVPGLSFAEARDDRGPLMIGAVEGDICIASTAHVMLVMEGVR